jgi:hypothetical protein
VRAAVHDPAQLLELVLLDHAVNLHKERVWEGPHSQQGAHTVRGSNKHSTAHPSSKNGPVSQKMRSGRLPGLRSRTRAMCRGAACFAAAGIGAGPGVGARARAYSGASAGAGARAGVSPPNCCAR